MFNPLLSHTFLKTQECQAHHVLQLWILLWNVLYSKSSQEHLCLQKFEEINNIRSAPLSHLQSKDWNVAYGKVMDH